MSQIDAGQIIAKIKSLRDNPKALMAALAFVFLLDGFILVRVQFIPLVHMWSKANKIKADIRQASVDSKSAATFKNSLNNLRAEIADLNKKAITEGDLPQALETISKFAAISTVKILRIRPMTEVRRLQKPVKVSNDEEFIREKISITAMAGFHQLGRFLALIENSPIFFDVRKLEIRTDSKEYTKHSITIFLDVVLRKS
ncbi:MAG TPA: hypothetical protein DCL35_08660 [Candidatus Omnitrophica bacterium]|nr:hypothetical protein [Candidatus Omnitrophota bacterium]